MSKLSKATVLKRATAKLSKTRAVYIANVRLILDARTVLCHPNCQGWFTDMDTCMTHRCDECAVENGYSRVVFDYDVAALPEAERALQKVLRA